MKPKLVLDKLHCSKCSGYDNVALTTDGTVCVIWCNCGHIEIFISDGMEVSVKSIED